MPVRQALTSPSQPLPQPHTCARSFRAAVKIKLGNASRVGHAASSSGASKKWGPEKARTIVGGGEGKSDLDQVCS